MNKLLVAALLALFALPACGEKGPDLETRMNKLTERCEACKGDQDCMSKVHEDFQALSEEGKKTYAKKADVPAKVQAAAKAYGKCYFKDVKR